jgi:hypothetical protein
VNKGENLGGVTLGSFPFIMDFEKFLKRRVFMEFHPTWVTCGLAILKCPINNARIF